MHGEINGDKCTAKSGELLDAASDAQTIVQAERLCEDLTRILATALLVSVNGLAAIAPLATIWFSAKSESVSAPPPVNVTLAPIASVVASPLESSASVP